MHSDTNYRPSFHFTPAENWMNDPNGMFYLDGTYHLYFQYYPDSNVWGPMHWGHATSKNLVDWKEHPIALYPDEHGYIFSGSAVVDYQNTSGLGTSENPPIVAIFTHHDPEKAKAEKIDVETQGIAYSLDQGMTWTKYEGNPVIKNPDIRDFRDPKVFWDDTNSQWVMVLAAQKKVMFYSSPNLKDWELLSDFGETIGHHGGVWECPDLFPLKIESTGETKWVLLVSINPGGPNEGSATQYFVGDFDGNTFRLDPTFKSQLDKENNFWVDFGRDNYAGVTWQNTERSNGNKLFIGWMSNWDYATKVPTTTWRSAMTIARELQLHNDENGFRLHSIPATELDARFEEIINLNQTKVTAQKTLVEAPTVELHKSKIEMTITLQQDTDIEFKLSNSANNSLAFGLDASENEYYVDRRKSGKLDFADKFAHRLSVMPRVSTTNTIQATLYIDKTSIELFWDNGKNVMTEIFFPDTPFTQLSVTTSNEIELTHFTIDQLN